MENVAASAPSATGYEALLRGDHVTARSEFERALSDGGGEEVLVHLGWLLESGLGGPVDIERGKALYRAALEHAPGLASYYLGRVLMREGNRIEGTPLLERATSLGNPSAAYWLYAYSSEANDPASKELAERSLSRAVELGHIFARRDLALRQVRSSRNFVSKVRALLQYWRSKFAGVALAIKDVNDWRVR